MWIRDKIKSLFQEAVKKEDKILKAGTMETPRDTLCSKELDLSETEKKERISVLTPRELDVFLLLLEGYTLKETAKHLGISYSTANTHQMAIYKKLGVNSKTELIINFRNLTRVPEANERNQ